MKAKGRLRHILLSTSLAAALTAASGAHAATTVQRDSTAHRGAHIAFTAETHNFGDIQRRGGDAEWRFEFVNDGDQPLIIKHLATTCTCLKYKYPRRPVAPGQSGHIDISYQPHKTEAGTFHRVVMVYSNSTEGVRRLVVQGNSIDNKRNPKR